MINPVPTVSITQADGSTLALSPATPSAIVGGLQVLAVDDLTASWGRSSYTEHHQSQTAKFTVLWPAGFGVSFGTNTGMNWDSWMGQPVTMSWRDPASGTVRGFFRGKVSAAKLRPRDPDRSVPEGRAPRPRGAFVDVVAMGTLTDVANQLTATEAWPEETGTARLARLSALVGSRVAGIDYRSFWAGAPMAARKVDATSCLDLLQAMYDTAGGDRMAYDPHTNRIHFVRRRSVQSPSAVIPTGSNWRARLRNDPALYAGGVHISAHAVNPWPMLDAKWIEEGRNYQRSDDSRITRAVYHWSETNGTVAKSNYIYDPGAEAAGGIRVADIQTELRDGGWAQTCGSDWFAIFTGEGRNPQPDPMIYRADLAGGFDTLAAAQLMIGGAETTDGTEFQGNSSLVFVAGSVHQALRLDAVYGVIGGSIRYVDGGWRATLNTMRAFWETTGGAGMHYPVKLRELKANSTLDTFRQSAMARSITWNDLRSVSSW